MIKFFRKIRQQLLMENKTSKYFKYAIGEIILVVIGILIALQINNWNEHKKTKGFEIKILKEIRSNLLVDLVEINEDLELMNVVTKATLDIEKHLKRQNKPTDSLYINSAILRVTPHFSPIKTGYDLLKTQRVGVISNDSLRKTISILYDQLYPYYKTYETERTRFHALHSEPILLNYYSMYYNKNEVNSFTGLYFKISIDDYKKLQKDDAFKKLLTAIAFENEAVKSRATRIKNNILKLKKTIELELPRLK